MAAADSALVRPLGAHAYTLSLSGRSARLRAGRASTARRRLRCDAAMVVRPVERTTEAVAPVSSATAAGCLQSGDGCQLSLPLAGALRSLRLPPALMRDALR